MDAHTSHFSCEALRAARANGILPCIIPASMTSLLQPLDTHVFARFKLFLRTRLHQTMLQGPNRDLTVLEVMDALMHTMKGVLQSHEWDPIFTQNGFGMSFQVRPHLLEAMDFASTPDVGSGLPSLAQFQCCLPSGRCVPIMGLLSGLLPPVDDAPPTEPDPAPDMEVDESVVEPWSVRLRPRLHGRVCPKAKAASTSSSSGLGAAPMPHSNATLEFTTARKPSAFLHLGMPASEHSSP